MKLKVTEQAIEEMLALPTEQRRTLWDTEITGFGVRPRATGAVFVMNVFQDGKLKLETIGPWDEMSVVDARKEALSIKGRRAKGELTPGDVKRLSTTGPTLREATEAYLEMMRSDGAQYLSIRTMRTEILEGRYVKDWLDRPIRTIEPIECRARHAKLAVKQPDGQGGPHIANRVFRHVRAVWNHASDAHSNDATWPRLNPTKAVHWISGEREDFRERAGDPIAWQDLTAWRAAAELVRPIRRDYLLFVLLTGLRRMDGATVMWDHLNLTDQPGTARVWNAGKRRFDMINIPAFSLVRPSPKGGPKKALLVPLSTQLVELLQGRKRDNTRDLGFPDGGWVFPTHTMKDKSCHLCGALGMPAHAALSVSHIVEPKEPNRVLRSPHRLRDTYATAAEQLQIPESTIERLMNHGKGKRKTVTRGYITHDFAYLGECQQKISDFLFGKMPLSSDAAGPRQKHCRRFPTEYKLAILKEWEIAKASGKKGAVTELLLREHLDSMRLTEWKRRYATDPAELQRENDRLRALLAGNDTNIGKDKHA